MTAGLRNDKGRFVKGHRSWCGSTERLEADHIEPVSLRPDLLLDINNGRTLCHDCHTKTDTYTGKMNRKLKEADLGTPR